MHLLSAQKICLLVWHSAGQRPCTSDRRVLPTAALPSAVQAHAVPSHCHTISSTLPAGPVDWNGAQHLATCRQPAFAMLGRAIRAPRPALRALPALRAGWAPGGTWASHLSTDRASPWPKTLQLVDGIMAGDRGCLSRSITLCTCPVPRRGAPFALRLPSEAARPLLFVPGPDRHPTRAPPQRNRRAATIATRQKSCWTGCSPRGATRRRRCCSRSKLREWRPIASCRPPSPKRTAPTQTTSAFPPRRASPSARRRCPATACPRFESASPARRALANPPLSRP